MAQSRSNDRDWLDEQPDGAKNQDMELVILALYVVFGMLTPGLVGMGFGGRRYVGASNGFALGFVLSWPGAFALLYLPVQVAPPRRIACSHCAEPVRATARVCPHCRHGIIAS